MENKIAIAVQAVCFCLLFSFTSLAEPPQQSNKPEEAAAQGQANKPAEVIVPEQASQQQDASSEAKKLLEDAKQMLSANNAAGAKQNAEKAYKLSSKDPAVLRQVVEVYLGSGDEELANKYLIDALALRDLPDRDWANSEYYNLAQKTKTTGEAVKKLEAEANKDLDNIGLQRSIAEGYIKEGDWNKVVEIYEGISKKAPDDYVINTRLIDYYMIQKNFDPVIKKLEPLVQADSGNTGASDILARAYTGSGNVDKAIELYKAKIDKEPTSPGLRGRYAQTLTDFGRLDEAVKEWQKAFELDPTNLFFKQREGEIYLQQGKNQEAKKAFEDLLRLTPENQQWYKTTATTQLQNIDNALKQ